jgi:hypothetical protein
LIVPLKIDLANFQIAVAVFVKIAYRHYYHF